MTNYTLLTVCSLLGDYYNIECPVYECPCCSSTCGNGSGGCATNPPLSVISCHPVIWNKLWKMTSVEVVSFALVSCCLSIMTFQWACSCCLRVGMQMGSCSLAYCLDPLSCKHQISLLCCLEVVNFLCQSQWSICTSGSTEGMLL